MQITNNNVIVFFKLFKLDNMKKYNNQTRCYKIDLFLNGAYLCSTDQSKTCKEAKKRYAARYYNGNMPAGLKANFFKQ